MLGKGDYVFEQGMAGSFFYILAEGECEMR
jgi:CRP-like cAMP-binding protein